MTIFLVQLKNNQFSQFLHWRLKDNTVQNTNILFCWSIRGNFITGISLACQQYMRTLPLLWLNLLAHLILQKNLSAPGNQKLYTVTIKTRNKKAGVFWIKGNQQQQKKSHRRLSMAKKPFGITWLLMYWSPVERCVYDYI